MSVLRYNAFIKHNEEKDMTCHLVDGEILEEKYALEKEKKSCGCKNYDRWEVEIEYTTGDSEGSHKEVDRLPISWKNKDLAKQAMKEILVYRAMKDTLHHQYKDKMDVILDWMVFHETGRLLQINMQFELDDGTRKVVSAFWSEDTFTHMDKMKIVRINDAEDDDSYEF